MSKIGQMAEYFERSKQLCYKFERILEEVLEKKMKEDSFVFFDEEEYNYIIYVAQYMFVYIPSAEEHTPVELETEENEERIDIAAVLAIVSDAIKEALPIWEKEIQ